MEKVKLMSNDEILFLFLNLDLGGFAYLLQSKWVAVIMIKTERTQIDISLSRC